MSPAAVRAVLATWPRVHEGPRRRDAQLVTFFYGLAADGRRSGVAPGSARRAAPVRDAIEVTPSAGHLPRGAEVDMRPIPVNLPKAPRDVLMGF